MGQRRWARRGLGWAWASRACTGLRAGGRGGWWGALQAGGAERWRRSGRVDVRGMEELRCEAAPAGVAGGGEAVVGEQGTPGERSRRAGRRGGDEETRGRTRAEEGAGAVGGESGAGEERGGAGGGVAGGELDGARWRSKAARGERKRRAG
ncbi:hypothetical protein BRADI_3g24425v3 [Brachypodium distachyon]|uniref:Uncharacterized protein n=1 Tax=Brachypodium distachyon TaxID=15368 RepID=A0A2K2CZ51_BRADI|nr:hypothetical protein BRADI_3g24425v3 [Brachypodium distachyon]